MPPTTRPRTEKRFSRQPMPPIDPIPAPPGRVERPARSSWRADAVTASGLNFLAGLWLIAAPWVLGYRGGDPYWNDVLFGSLVAIFAATRLGGALRASGLAAINAAIGAWVFVSAFVLDSSSTASWNDIVLGIVVFVLAAISMSASAEGELHQGPRQTR